MRSTRLLVVVSTRNQGDAHRAAHTEPILIRSQSSSPTISSSSSGFDDEPESEANDPFTIEVVGIHILDLPRISPISRYFRDRKMIFKAP
jgi:hypothetical protein